MLDMIKEIAVCFKNGEEGNATVHRSERIVLSTF